MAQSQDVDWLIQIADEPGSSRPDWQPQHLTYNRPRVAAGKLVFAGPTLVKHPGNVDAALEITGSVMVVKAKSAEEVLEALKKDPFIDAGIWKPEKAIITPFKNTVRVPL